MGSLNMQDNQQQRPYKNARPPRDSTNGNGEPSRSDDQRQFDKKDKKKRDKKFNQQQNQPQQTNQSPQSPTQVIRKDLSRLLIHSGRFSRREAKV